METGSTLIVALLAVPLATIYVSAAMLVQREHQANHDELTGLVNRKLLAKRGYDALGGHREGFADCESDLLRRLGRRRITLLRTAVMIID